MNNSATSYNRIANNVYPVKGIDEYKKQISVVHQSIHS